MGVTVNIVSHYVYSHHRHGLGPGHVPAWELGGNRMGINTWFHLEFYKQDRNKHPFILECFQKMANIANHKVVGTGFLDILHHITNHLLLHTHTQTHRGHMEPPAGTVRSPRLSWALWEMLMTLSSTQLWFDSSGLGGDSPHPPCTMLQWKMVPQTLNSLFPSLAACLCAHGACDNRVDSDGACLSGTCREGTAGKFCNKQTSTCGPYVYFCHIHATCKYYNGTAR